MRYLGFAIAILASGCAGTTRMIPIEYRFHDIPEERRIEITYHNDLKDTLCLSPETWPNEAGKINQASEYVFLVIDGRRFPIVDFNTGYCPEADGCALYVSPGQETSASISYSDFNVPKDLENLEKELEFSPVAFKCRTKKHR